MGKNKKISVTAIIPNRNGDMIDYVIKNYEETYPEISFKFIIIEQEDDTLFKKGQLYNIAFKYVDTEYIMLLDNDFINLDKINFLDAYEKYNKSVVLFDSVSQCYIKNNIPVVISTAIRKIDSCGGCVLMKPKDFIEFGGFSNLCVGWGHEDIIFGLKSSCKRVTNHSFGHIMHPRRININKISQENNKKIYFLYRDNKIDYQEDGYKQTTAEIVFNYENDNVRRIGVTNVGVTDDYKYMDLYKEVVAIDKKETRLSKKEDKGVSICIAAYKAKNTIKETLDSIISQTWFYSHNNWEILVGIDGCEETLEYMKTIMNNYKNLKVFMMDSNKGTYITSNTLMGKIAKYDYVLRFDADDLMENNYVEALMTSNKNADFYRFLFTYLNLPPTLKSNVKLTSFGQIAIKRDVFRKFGGYRPWLCAADKELALRLEKFVKQERIENTCVLKRYVATSLMYAEKTKYPSSPLRQEYHNFIDNEIIESEEDAIIDMETNTYTEVFSSIHEYNQSSYICLLNSVSTNTKNGIREKSVTIKRNIIKKYSPYSNSKLVKKAYTVKLTDTPVKRIVVASKVKVI